MSAPAHSFRPIKLLAPILSLTAAVAVALHFEPRVAAAQRSLEDARRTLQSDEVAFASSALLRMQRDSLREQVRELVAGQPESNFVRDLARVAALHRVRIVSTSFQRSSQGAADRTNASAPTRMERERVSVSLEGGYGNLLETLAELSRGTALISVGQPSIRRSAASLVIVVPLTLFDPPRELAP